MKKLTKPTKSALAVLSLLIIALMAFQFGPQRPTNYEPILMSRTDMEKSVQLSTAREIDTPGKIWVYNDVILLIEMYKGIHIIDNSNPASSKNIAFIQVDGCTDITMKDNILYANNAVDMIGIKPNQDFTGISVVSRNRNMLPTIASPEPLGDWYFLDKLPKNTIIVRWIPNQN